MIDYSKSDGVCILRLDDPPLNAIGFELLEELVAAVERANADEDVSGIILTGADDHFSAGADVNLFEGISSAEQAMKMSRVFQDALDAVENSQKTTVAAVTGKVVGCALELAMACRFRVCTCGSRFSNPEVTLAINPGAGGTQRLPRLIGVESALRMLLTAKPIDAKAALELGLVDVVCQEGQLIDTAGRLLQSGRTAVAASRRIDKIADIKTNDEAFENAQKLVEKVRPEIVAPKKIIEAVRTGLDESYEAGLKKEQKNFAECMDTLATRSKIYLFFAGRKIGKVPELEQGAAAKIVTAAVVGTGSMGAGIAQALAAAGLAVVMTDNDEQAVDRAMRRIHKSLERRVERGKMSRQRADAMIERISIAQSWNDIAPADIFIEAVFEDIAVKREVMQKIEAVCRRDAIIASNTSTINLDELAEALAYSERVIGLHFFNPAQSMPLVEVTRRDATNAGVIATAMKFVKDIRKTPILVNNREGFVVNRLFIPYLKEAFRLLEDGADPRAVDAAMVDFGFAMGPLTLIDMAGIDILEFTDRQMCRAFPAHVPLSRIATFLVEQGCCGQKTGCGVYRYVEGGYTPKDSDTTREIIADVQEKLGKTAREVGVDEITDRLVLRMVAEAFCVVQEQIAQRQSDIDVAMVLGTGFPDFRGGVLKYAYDTGLETVASRLDVLADRFGERFRPCEFLRNETGV
ncbi:MAG: 3-hydroxyacyl-CoA dehydrogenase NAD-binding domain-containing protein [Planctomycetota bacterium]|jgi:3-hydroxyacyl-CoA dehydrogenase